MDAGLSAELAVAIYRLLPIFEDFRDSLVAFGCGEEASETFLELIEDFLPQARLQEVAFGPLRMGVTTFRYEEAPHPWYRNGLEVPDLAMLPHVVPVVNGWCVDWTARQFNPEAPFPLVFRL